MSGHSKWATIKRAKASTDAKKSAIFTKFANNIAIAAKKGADPSINFSLRMAIDKAKSVNMPKDSIEKAIKRGSGQLGVAIDEITYEGFGPANTQFIIKCLSNNKNRTAAEIRHIFTKYGGGFGAVSWNFEQLGVINIDKQKISIPTEELELHLIEANAKDILINNDNIIIHTNIQDLENIKKTLEELNTQAESAEIEYVAKETIQPSEEAEQKIEKFINALEENEDVVDHYSNI